MNPETKELVGQVMQRHAVPGMVVAVASGEGAVEFLVAGHDASGQALRFDDLFPVASISKLATALAILRLCDSGQIGLDDPLARWLPEAAASQPGVTLRRLLCHTGGTPEDLPHERATYAHGLTWSVLREACLKTPLERAPNTRVVYSNVGYGLLAIVVERRMKVEYAAALRELVLTPLGLESYLGQEPPRRVVHVEDVRSSHRGTDREPFNSPFWRELALPWAGLVTTAEGALNLVRAFQGHPADFLTAETRREATRNQTDHLGGGYGGPFIYPHAPWGLGPDLRGDKKPHWAPAEAGADCYGHAGASGCVAWVAPSVDIAWAILGSRTADNGWLLRGTPALGAAILSR